MFSAYSNDSKYTLKEQTKRFSKKILPRNQDDSNNGTNGQVWMNYNNQHPPPPLTTYSGNEIPIWTLHPDQTRWLCDRLSVSPTTLWTGRQTLWTKRQTFELNDKLLELNDKLFELDDKLSKLNDRLFELNDNSLY